MDSLLRRRSIGTIRNVTENQYHKAGTQANLITVVEPIRHGSDVPSINEGAILAVEVPQPAPIVVPPNLRMISGNGGLVNEHVSVPVAA
jgi:hypothetical protein